MPSVLPASSYTRCSPMSPTRHFPATTLLCIHAMRLRTERISMIVCSATATEFAPPLLATGTPAWRAASMSSRS